MSDNSGEIEQMEQQVEEVNDYPLEVDEEKYEEAEKYANETPVEQYSPDSPRVNDDFEGDGIPVIDDEEYDDDLQDDLDEQGNEMIKDEKDKLLEFNTVFDIDDLLLVVFFDKNKYEEYLGVITDITDDHITLNGERDIYYSEGYIQLLHKDYNIIDITKIREVSFDILEGDDIFKEEKIELDVQIKTKKEKIYTDSEIKEDFISNILSLYDIYNNELLIRNVTEMAYDFIDIINKSKLRTDIDDKDYLGFIKELNKTNILNLPSFIVPIVGMKKKIFDSETLESDDIIISTTEEDLVNKYDKLNATDDYSSKGYNNYINNLFSDEFSSYINDHNKYGCLINHSGLVIRDCFDDKNPCNSLNSQYILDTIKIRNELNIIHNYDKELIVEKRNINFIGFLFIPIEDTRDLLNFDSNNLLFNPLFNLIDIIYLNKDKNLRKTLSKYPIDSISINVKSEKPEYLQNLKRYLFDIDKDLSYEEFKDIITQNFPSNSDMIDALNVSINEDSDIYLTDLFYNYDDIEKILYVLNISLGDIKYDKKRNLNKIIEKNINEYNSNYKKVLNKFIKPIKPIKKITKELDSKEKIKLCKELIFSQTDLIYRNSLLSKFISIYGREANKETEDNSFYYDKSNDSQKLICKHYLYLIKGDKDSFDSMKSLYGEVSKDGNIYCKKCSCFICYDDFSIFEGFNEGKPTSSKEVAEDIEVTLDLNKKEIKEAYDIIKYISEKFNIVLQNDDMINIIDLYNLINQQNLYDMRYDSDIIKTHPFLKNNKSKSNINSLKDYLQYINNILSAIFLIFIQIQISNNSYNINFNNRINLINSDDSWKTLYVSDKETCLNMKVITYIEAKLKSLVKKYPKEKIFNHIGDLFSEFDIYKTMKLTFKDHFINVIRYWMNPQYNLYSKLEKYFLFESGINKGYIKDYWTTYKPLPDNILIKHINNLVQSNNETYKKYFVNNNSLQNISLLKSINIDEPKYQELDIKLSELMNNPSFKRLYTYALKGYGKSPVLPILNLLTKQFIDTFTPSHKKELISILSKCHYNHERGEYSSINYNLIKKTFLDEIIELDIKKDSDNILKFIHINNNNHEYFLLNSNINRHYSYTPPNVYIADSYDNLVENNSPILTKMFKYYCLDKNENLIPNQVKEVDGEIINTNIVNFLLLDFNEELIENISECSNEVPNTIEYFDKILNHLIDKNKLDLPHLFISYTESYSNQYIINNINQNTLIETRLLDFFDEYTDDTDIIYDTFNNIKDLLELIIYKKDNNDVIDKNELSIQFDGILRLIISQNKKYMENSDRWFNKLIENDMYTKFNELQRENISFKLNKREKDKLETDIGFTPETNIPYLLNNILKKLDDKIVCDKMIHNMFYYLSFLKNTPNGDFNPRIKKNEWRMSESKTGYISEYLERNTFLLHNNIFLRNKDKDFESGNKYSGFNQYRKPFYYIFFNGLYDYINKYRSEIYKLKTNNDIFKESQLKVLNKCIYLFIINKIIEYIQSLLDDTSKEYIDAKKQCDLIDSTDITIDNNIIILSRFLLDVLTNTYDKLYDLNWIYIDSDTYKNKLDEHNAREKQMNLDRLDHMTDEQRRLHVANQSIKSGTMYKESEKVNLERIVGGEKEQQIMDEREEQKKNLFEETINSGDTIGDNLLQDESQDNIDPDADEGYYDQDDFAADGEENEDNLDALQLNEGD